MPILATADDTTGTVVAFDPASNVLLLPARTVWMLPAGTAIPHIVRPREKIRLPFLSNADNGRGTIARVERATIRPAG
jgi:hypothetical protein